MDSLLWFLTLFAAPILTERVAVEAAYTLHTRAVEPVAKECCGSCKNGFIVHGDGHKTPCPCPPDCECKRPPAAPPAPRLPLRLPQCRRHPCRPPLARSPSSHRAGWVAPNVRTVNACLGHSRPVFAGVRRTRTQRLRQDCRAHCPAGCPRSARPHAGVQAGDPAVVRPGEPGVRLHLLDLCAAHHHFAGQ